nr:MAG TPA: hypothetical protein [Caudoviricetes sp.]
MQCAFTTSSNKINTIYIYFLYYISSYIIPQKRGLAQLPAPRVKHLLYLTTNFFVF